MKSDCQQFIAVLFLSRDAAHKAHLNTESYAEHKTLGKFYDGVIDLADKFAEAYMGRTGKRIGEIPDMKNPKSEIRQTLKAHREVIEEMRDFIGDDTPLQNIVDEIVDLYLSTEYMLTLK